MERITIAAYSAMLLVAATTFCAAVIVGGWNGF